MEESSTAGIVIIQLLFMLVFYFYFSYCLMVIGKKAGTGKVWMAWVPIINMFYPLMVAKKPMWWIILLFVPLVNIVISVMMWMAVAKEVNKPEWIGILMLVPFVNFVIPAYLAFAGKTPVLEQAAAPTDQQQPPTPPVQPMQ